MTQAQQVPPQALPVPPAFDPSKFADEPPAPYSYRGVQFGFDRVAEMVQSGGEDHVVLLRTPVAASNIQLGEPGHPISFAVTGRQYRYVVTMWADRIMVKLYGVPKGGRLLSASFPETEDHLRVILTDIVTDYETATGFASVAAASTVVPKPRTRTRRRNTEGTATSTTE